MLLSGAPTKTTVPFANSGAKNTIPVAASATPGLASYTTGFPALTMTPLSAGGIPPAGQDFNGILNAISQAVQYYSAGFVYPYDATFASAVSGYPQGAVVTSANGTGSWRNLVDSNTTNPDAGGAGWVAAFPAGVVGQVRNLAANLTAAGSSVVFTADEIIVETAPGGQTYRLSSFNKTLNVGTVGVNGMDTGTAPANGNIAIYAIYNPITQTAGLLAQSVGTAVAPMVYGGANMPIGYTASALISAVAISSTAGQMATFNQNDRDIGAPSTVALGLSTASGVTILPGTITIPGNAKEIKGWLNVANSTNGVLQFTIYDTLSGLGAQASGVNTTGQIGLFCSYSKLKITTPRTIYYTLTSTAGVASVTVYFSGYSV